MAKVTDKTIFGMFFLLYGLQSLGVWVLRRAMALATWLYHWLPIIGHAISSFLISLFQSQAHGKVDDAELKSRKVDYLGYVGFASLTTSLAVYIVTAGPIGRYVTWYWMTRDKPWMRH